MSAFSLRLTALTCMLADHTGLALFPGAAALRCIGRLSFPLYCFLLVQGYLHTRDLRAYARRLLLAAFVTEVPFDLLIFASIASPVEQNALFSLLLALMALYAGDALDGLQALMVQALLCVFAMAAGVSYGWLGIALCLCIRHAGESRTKLILSVSAALLTYSLSLLLSGVLISWVLISLCALLSLIPMLAYNGRCGARSRVLTALFYTAYPLHLLLLAGLRAMRIVPPYWP